MEAREILRADLLDILFDNRNKQYGAYKLRRTYTKRLGIALGLTIMVGMAAALLVRPVAAEDDNQLIAVREVVLQNIAELEVPPPPPPPPPPKEEAPAPEKVTTKAAVPQAAAPRVKTTKYTPPVIVDDEEVAKSEVPPVSEITKVDVVSLEGIRADDLALSTPKVADAPVGPGKEPGTVLVPPAEEDEHKIFEKVEIEARVPAAQWRRHLERHLVRYIEEAAYEGMSPGTYTVRVRFLVEKDGSIGRVKALNKPGYGLARGAEEVVKSGPRWIAAEQNGRKVRSYHTQPITFVIMES